MIMALFAGLIVFAQWFMVHAGDAFTLVQHEGQTYKVFSCGFPFKVVDCNAVLGLATPEKQIFWRLIGNWGTFLLIGLVMIKTIRKFRTSGRTVRAEAGRP